MLVLRGRLLRVPFGLERDAEVVYEHRVVGEGLQDGAIGARDVRAVARERRPAERPLALAEQRPDVLGHEAGNVERVGHARLLRLRQLGKLRLALSRQETDLLLRRCDESFDRAADIIFERGGILQHGDRFLPVFVEEDESHVCLLDLEFVLVDDLNLDGRDPLLLGILPGGFAV